MSEVQSEKKVAAFGEVLIDRFPDGSHIGGAPMNVAVHLRRLGISADLYSSLGDDEDGSRIRTFLAEENLDQKISQARRLPTGHAEVKSVNGKNTFHLEMLSAWSEIEVQTTPEDQYQVLYFGSLACNSPYNQNSLDKLKSAAKSPKLFCDLNIRMPHCSIALTDWCLTRADVLKISDEELEQLSRWYGLPKDYQSALPEILHRWKLDKVFLTLGADGSCCADQSGRLLQAKPHPIEELKDTVGAGDSFTAMTLEGLLSERPLQDILDRASQFSSLMCTISGALPKDTAFYSEFQS